MRAARIFVIIFLVMALLGWTVHTVSALVISQFAIGVDYALMISFLGLLIAYGQQRLNTFSHNLFVGIVGSAATGTLLWSIRVTLRPEIILWCVLPAIFAWIIAGGFCFLRIAGEDRFLPRLSRKPLDVLRRSLRFYSGIGFLYWLLLMIGRIFYLCNAPWTFELLPAAVGGLILAVGFCYSIAGLGHQSTWKYSLAFAFATAGCLLSAMDRYLVSSSIGIFCSVLLALVPLYVLNRRERYTIEGMGDDRPSVIG